MTLQGSGAISLSQIAGEFGGKNPLELGEYRGQDNAPTTGAISFSNFYGTDGIPTSGLQYHYDGQISEHNDPSTGNVQDLGSSNYTGTLTNGAAFNTGNFGKIVFDGVDDYVNLSGYNGVTGTTARTSIVFFKLDNSTQSGQQRLFTWGDSTSGTGKKWAMEINTSNNFNMGIGGAYRQSNKTLTPTNWNMIAATFSGGSGAGTSSAIFDFLYVGTVVSGTGVPNNTTVTAFNSTAGTITLSNNLTTTLSNTTLTFTNTYLFGDGGNGGGGGGASGGSGGGSDGLARTNGGNGGSGGNGASDGGGGGGAGGYTGNGGGENSNGSGGGGAGGANDGDGGGGVGIYGSGSSGSAPRGGGSGGTDGQNTSGTGGDGGQYGGGGGGVRGNNGSGSGGDGANGAVRFVWGSLSYPSNAGNASSSTADQYTSTGSDTWTVPSGVTSVSAVVVGGGGGGGDNDPDKDDEGGGGGGGGGLAYGSWSVTAGDVYTVVVGSGGNGGNGDGDDGQSGNESYIRRAETEAVSGTSGTNTITAGSGAADDIPNITLYHNAQKLVNYTDSSGAIDTSTGTNVAIGRANAGVGGYIDGEIAKALIYNRELTHAEIAQIYNAKCVALGLSQATASTEVLVQNDIEYVTGTTSQTTSISLSGIQSGDLLLLFGATDSGDMNTNDPSGWSDLTTNNTSGQPDNDNNPDSTAYYKFATGTSESVFGLTDPNAGAIYVMMAFRYVNSTTPFNTTTQETNFSGSNLSLPSITTTSDGCMIVGVGFLDDDNVSSVTGPSGYTLGPYGNVGGALGAGSTFASLMTAYKLQTSAGTESPGSFNLGFFGNDTYKTYTIALNPV